MARKAKPKDEPLTFYESISKYAFSYAIRKKIESFCEGPDRELRIIARGRGIEDYETAEKEYLVHEILYKIDERYRLEFCRESLVARIRENFELLASDDKALMGLLISAVDAINEMLDSLGKVKNGLDGLKNSDELK